LRRRRRSRSWSLSADKELRLIHAILQILGEKTYQLEFSKKKMKLIFN